MGWGAIGPQSEIEDIRQKAFPALARAVIVIVVIIAAATGLFPARLFAAMRADIAAASAARTDAVPA
jgi:hypothetical protein